MTIYDRLQPLEPFLAGPWRWVTYALIGGGILLAAWAACSRRWRPDGVRRCLRCRHPFDPTADFGDAGMRCSECGQLTATEREALRRRGRAAVVLGGIAATAVFAVPLLAWHGMHVFAARVLMPRWVAIESASIGDGVEVVLEGDPLQAWLGWLPNSRSGAWDGGFFDEDEGSDPPSRSGWPFPWRIRANAVSQGGAWSCVAHFHARPVFGAMASASMPAPGEPGFGGDLAVGGGNALVVGEPNVGSGGGVEWHRLSARDQAPAFAEVGWGTWVRDGTRDDWTFARTCHGFRYGIVAGVYLSDWDVTCTWDPARRAWLPSPERMRRPLRRDFLADVAEDAGREWDECRAGGLRVDAAAIGDNDMLPCPGMIGALSMGVMEFVFTGHGSEWVAWVDRAWPADADPGLRAVFVRRMSAMIDGCTCAADLRALGAGPQPSP